jgi:hypothetical protein
MNVNLLQPAGPWPTTDNVWSQIQDSLEVLESAGFDVTGKVTLVDANALMPGVFQVWYATKDGRWLWINEDGTAHWNCHPTDPGHEAETRQG